MELEKKIDELGRVVQEFKTAHQKEMDEVKKTGHASSETLQKVDKLNDRISELEKGISDTKAALNRSAKGGEGDEKPESEYSKKLQGYLRKGKEFDMKQAWEAEHKALNVQVDEDGGFLVTPEMSSEVVKKVYETSPMRQLASVQTISSDALEILEDLDEAEGGWVGEQQARPETGTPQLNMVKIPVHEIYANPKATQKLLDDAAINIEAWLSGKVSDIFSRKENTAFVSGDGIMKPKGILAYASGTGFDQIERINSGVSGDFDADDMIDLIYSLKEAYLPNASLLMQRATVKKLRKFKGSDGQYLWAPGLNGAGQSTFSGHPIYQAADMEAVGADAQAVLFGDIRQGYQIVDRIGIRVLRDVYTSKPNVLFYTTKRVGGGVKNFEAMKILKLSV